MVIGRAIKYNPHNISYARQENMGSLFNRAMNLWLKSQIVSLGSTIMVDNSWTIVVGVFLIPYLFIKNLSSWSQLITDLTTRLKNHEDALPSSEYVNNLQDTYSCSTCNASKVEVYFSKCSSADYLWWWSNFVINLFGWCGKSCYCPGTTIIILALHIGVVEVVNSPPITPAIMFGSIGDCCCCGLCGLFSWFLGVVSGGGCSSTNWSFGYSLVLPNSSLVWL